MNAIDLLKGDHDRVETLFEKFKQNEDGDHAKLFRQIRDELETHTHIEETVFYPAALKRGKADLKKIVREGFEEHAQVKNLLADLGKMRSSNKQFNAKLKVVVENVEHHVEEEEDEMFPLAEDQFTDLQLEKLGREMEAEKKTFQKKHGIKPAPEQKSAVASILDKTKEVVSDLFAGSSRERPKKAKKPGRTGSTKKTSSRSRTSARSNGKGNGRPNNARAKSTGSSGTRSSKPRKRATSSRTSR